MGEGGKFMKHINITSGSQCTGCSACKAVCPMDAIVFKEDPLGFNVPVVDESKCIDCGACLRVHKEVFEIPKSIPVSAYAARVDSKAKDSSSGGVSAALAEKFHPGYVFGAVMDLDGNVFHIECGPDIIGIANLERIRGSKYAQSDISSSLPRIRELLKAGEKVLFTGTPCQVHGLKTYLKYTGTDMENLLTVDIVCHGVPSARMFSDYLKHIEGLFPGMILEKFTFRDKNLGWGKSGSAYLASKREDGDDIHLKLWESSEPYLYYFGRASLCRDCCYECRFTSVNARPADITLGDFWGIESQHPSFKIKDGVSAVICNTEKGEKAFKELSCEFIESSAEKIVEKNAQLQKPSVCKDPEIREIYKKDGWEGVEKVFLNLPWITRHKSQIKALLPKWLKHKLKAAKN